MIDSSDIIDVESLDLSDDQTWLYTIPSDSGSKLNIVEWSRYHDFQYKDEEYIKSQHEMFEELDNIHNNEDLSLPDKHKFDSRTYVRPKRRVIRPSIQSIVEVSSNPPSLSNALSANKYLTYNKYNAPVSPLIRLKTFNLDINTENSGPVKDFASKRRSLIQDEDPQFDDSMANRTLEGSGRLSEAPPPTKPINIDLSQPAHNLHNTFNKGFSGILSDRNSLNMYKSGDSLMRMSPPSLVSSLLLDGDNLSQPRNSDIPTQNRESIDPMVTSMTLSILDEKDMNTSFLSQTTYPDHDSLMDSLPPSLVSSINSSFVIPKSPRLRQDSCDSNIFSSATFTHLEQSEKLLSARPRHQMFNSFTRRDSLLKNSESYTKSREEACQIDATKVLNENIEKKESPKTSTKLSPEMSETVTLHFSNNKFKMKSDAEKENLNSTFEKDDAFYKDMGLQRTVEMANKTSLNTTLDKQELNEIIQARQKLSLARKALPNEPEKPPESQNVEKIQLPNQTITVPRQSMENASELLSRRRSPNAYIPNKTVTSNGLEKAEEISRETPKRNATFKRVSPRSNSMDATVVYVKNGENQNIIDINSATLNLIDSGDRITIREDWGLQERAMIGSNESTDTGTFSSSSPPESVPDPTAQPHVNVASTPLACLKKGSKNDFLTLHSTISPIYDVVGDKSYTITKAPSTTNSSGDRYDPNSTVVNTATLVKKSAKRDILNSKTSPDKRSSGLTGPVAPAPAVTQRTSPVQNANNVQGTHPALGPPTGVPRKTGLPTSKLRHYSSHKELSRIPGGNPTPSIPTRGTAGRGMARRGVYASNPALSPTTPTPLRQASYIIHKDEDSAPAPAGRTLVRQGTETLRRDRPPPQLVAPKDFRGTIAGHSTYVRNQQIPPPATRPVSIAGISQLKAPRPVSGPLQKTVQSNGSSENRPATSEGRVSCLPRPSRLPAPRRSIRPPSVYSVAPTGDVDQY